MIPGIKTIATLFMLFFVMGMILAMTGQLLLTFICFIALCILSHILNKHKDYYDEKLDELYPEDNDSIFE